MVHAGLGHDQTLQGYQGLALLSGRGDLENNERWKNLMLAIWFMFDNHTFGRITGKNRETILKQAGDFFRGDGCGSLFVRDEYDGTLDALSLHGRRLGSGKYGILASELEKWVDEIEAERSFRTLMA